MEAIMSSEHAELKITEGKIPFKGYHTWFKRVGESVSGKLPLLVLHGGPGATHNYLESLYPIAESGRELIYYDQLGCGNSPVDEGPDFYNINLWVEEVAVVRKALDLDKVHILGQPFGATILIDYAATQPKGVQSIILSSPHASYITVEREIGRLLNLMPQDMRIAIKNGIANKDYDSPEFLAASDEFYRRHIINVDSVPDYVEYSTAHFGPAYEIMQGKTEFDLGTLKGFDLTDRFAKIDIPTLLVSGTDDTATPLHVKEIFDGIKGSKWELLEGTHFVQLEQQEKFNRIVDAFMDDNEKR
jgi:proline iminopeptidase